MKIVFEDVRLGSWNNVDYGFAVPRQVKEMIKNSNVKLKIKRDCKGGASMIKDAILSFRNKSVTEKVGIGEFAWDDDYCIEFSNGFDLETINSNHFMRLSEMVFEVK